MSDLRKQTCRHFNGIQHDACGAGISYASVRQGDKTPRERFPCFHLGGADICPHWQAITPEEIAQEDAEIVAIIGKLNAFASGVGRACPTCGKEVTGARLYAKSEPDIYSLYVLPCNCRQGLWEKAPAWITSVEIVPLSDEGEEV